MNKLKAIYRKFSPPGMDITRELVLYLVGLALAAITALTFFAGYTQARNALYDYDQLLKKMILRENAVIADFDSVLAQSLSGFIILSVCVTLFIAFRYTYYSQGSQSIYLMKRLPSSLEIHKRAIPVPLFLALLSIALAFVFRMIFFAIYVIATPKQCLPVDVWLQIWRIL